MKNKIKDVIFLNRAFNEFADSKEYYESRQKGLGDKFSKEVYETVDRIKENPYQFPKSVKNLHSARLITFPFLIFFDVKELVVRVFSVFHTSRDPENLIS